MFSVVIPLYNKKHTIRECIASVLSQSYQDFELLVIDDGSTDNSFQVVSEYSDNRIRIVQQSNGGVSSARNLGLKLAKSKYVALLDADDLWMPDYLEKMNSFIESYPFCALYGSRQYVVDGKGYKKLSDTLGQEQFYLFHKEEYFKYATDAILFHTSAVIVNKEIIQAHGLSFNTNLKTGEDLDFFFRIALKENTAFLNEPLTVYNLEVEGSAMRSYCDLSNRLIGNIGQYREAMESYKSVRIFFSEYILSCIPLLILEHEPTSVIKTLSRLIDVDALPLIKKVYYYLPLSMKLFIYKLYMR